MATALLPILATNRLNFLKRCVHRPFLKLSIINFGDINMKIYRCPINRQEPGKTAQICMLDWLLIHSWFFRRKGDRLRTKRSGT